MKEENNELLLRDLCARLPYGAKVLFNNKVYSIDYVSCIYEEIKLDICDNYTLNVSDVKPYLFPLSSMTEEQKDIFGKLWWNTKGLNMAMHAIDWLNKNHFDYRGLIEKGLAIDATDLNIY